MKQSSVLCSTILALFSSPLLASAGNWPEWRGPDGTGVSSEKNVVSIQNVFLKYFPEAKIEVGWNLLTAARALCGHKRHDGRGRRDRLSGGRP